MPNSEIDTREVRTFSDPTQLCSSLTLIRYWRSCCVPAHLASAFSPKYLMSVRGQCERSPAHSYTLLENIMNMLQVHSIAGAIHSRQARWLMD